MKGVSLEGLNDCDCGGGCDNDCGCGGGGNNDRAININVSTPVNVGSKNNYNSRNKVPGQAGGVYEVPDQRPAPMQTRLVPVQVTVPVPVAVPIQKIVKEYVDIVPDVKPAKKSTIKQYFREFP